MDHNNLSRIIQMKPRDVPPPKEITFFLHKQVTNPWFGEMKENNQSQNQHTGTAG